MPPYRCAIQTICGVPAALVVRHTISAQVISPLPSQRPPHPSLIRLPQQIVPSKGPRLRSQSTADEWAVTFFENVVRRWGLSKEIISDRGSVFISGKWKGLFRRYKVELLFSTSYHLQTDGQSEATKSATPNHSSLLRCLFLMLYVSTLHHLIPRHHHLSIP